VAREAGALFAHPGLELRDERRDLLLPDGKAPSAGRPLMARSAAKIASMRRTASAASGARATSASLNSLRRPCAQHAASVIGPGLRSAA
jgi:hypothetical protein